MLRTMSWKTLVWWWSSFRAADATSISAAVVAAAGGTGTGSGPRIPALCLPSYGTANLIFSCDSSLVFYTYERNLEDLKKKYEKKSNEKKSQLIITTNQQLKLKSKRVVYL